MTRRMRLDALVAGRGLAPTRARARALVLAGQVRVNGATVSKAGAAVPVDADVALAAPDHPYVGRGGIKLAHALDALGVRVAGRTALDIGASTGGFTDVLLRRGAAAVAALDVGRGQLAWKIRQDPRVTVIEGVNARGLGQAALPPAFHAVDVVTVDVSFISLKLVLPPLPPLLRPGADVVALVKPQFEAGRAEVGRRGVVTDAAVHARVVDEVRSAADRIGLSPVAETPSPVAGAEGNREFFVHLRRRAPPMTAPRMEPPGAVGIVAKTRLQEAASVVAEAADWLAGRGVAVVLETDTARLAGRPAATTCSRDELPAAADLIVVLGGDGTLLGVAGRVARAGADTPILAVNFGSLGFLTEITLPELYAALESVLAGTAGIDERRMLQARVMRGERAVAERIVLNDVVLTKAALSNIIDFSVTSGGQFVMRARADGLIISTPTGSTAYNLAAGGPIVHPRVDAVLVTPLAPHTLTNRPIVIPTTPPIGVTPGLGEPHQAASASFDGQFGVELEAGDRVTVQRAPRPLRVVRAESRSYFAVLREKLKWGER